MNKKVKTIKLVDGISRREIKPIISEAEKTKSRKWTLVSSGLKIAGVALVSLVLSVSLSSVGGTVSYFSDIETSLNNLLRAGSLDFSVALAEGDSPNIKLTGGDPAVTIIPTVTGGVGDFPLAYKIHIEKTGGTSEAFCNAIDLTASAGSFNYTGKLMAFVEGTTTTLGPLSLSLSLPAGGGFTITDSCLVDVVYSGWIDGQTEGIQYHDIERVALSIFDPPAENTTQSFEQSTSTEPVIDNPALEATSTPPTPEPTPTAPDLGGGGSPSPEPAPSPEVSPTPLSEATTTPPETPPVVETPPAEPVVETPPPAGNAEEPAPEVAPEPPSSPPEPAPEAPSAPETSS